MCTSSRQGRGIRTLRGLRGPVPKTIFSPDGRLIAGLSQDWQVAIWDRASGQLRITLDVPQGDVRRQLRPGLQPRRPAIRLLGRPPGETLGHRHGQGIGCLAASRGLDDRCLPGPISSFCSAWRPQDGRPPPISSTPPKLSSGPAAANLLGDRPTEPVRVITDFNWHVHHTAATPDGNTSWSKGLAVPRARPGRSTPTMPPPG